MTSSNADEWERITQRRKRTRAKRASDGVTRVDVVCRKCSRKWMRLNGDADGLAKRGIEYVWFDHGSVRELSSTLLDDHPLPRSGY